MDRLLGLLIQKKQFLSIYFSCMRRNSMFHLLIIDLHGGYQRVIMSAVFE